jgi:hypothetical protein
MSARGGGGERGIGIVELLVSLVILVVTLVTLATMLSVNTRINGSQQLTLEVQANARSSIALIVPAIRSAGWDPTGAGFVPLQIDTVSGNWIRLFADLNGDGDTDDASEDVTIRFQGGQIERKSTSDPLAPFDVLADGISNDADANGTPEPMFTVDDVAEPTRVAVQVTARSIRKDPASGAFLLRTCASDITLRTRS